MSAPGKLQVESVSKRFGGLRVFDDVSFVVEPGEVVGVIGPNGAGKTTMINVVCGMLSVTSGRILLDGRELTGKPPSTMSKLGIVRSFQQTNTFRSASVAENLFRARRFSASPAADDPGLDGLMEEFGLAGLRQERSDRLPYGLQKMLGLLMVLVTRPRYLLLDEPAAGLERRERPQVDRFISYAQQALGCGVLIVEHDMDLVRRLCPRVIVLESGRLLAEGAPADVLTRQDVIDAYLGTSPE